MAASKSKAGRPSKVVKPKQTTRRTTVAHRNHRFETFTERISKVKVDPIRRRRDNEERDELVDARATYFGRALARWRDVNLSQVFVAFATRASTLSDTLPMLLHNQDQIMTLLVDHIERGDGLSLEPLLGLMADFAHDLDARFEKHFQQAVKTISAVAARHQDAAVVEWSFNCLAWLFKYLSRLLTPNLRPVFDLMAPYLGKTSQKPHIVRFAAESMSFLLRKAAIASTRNVTPFETIIRHILADLRDDEHNPKHDLYRQGVMVLLTDAIQGVQQSLHSAGPAILRMLMEVAREQQSSSATSIIGGILTSLVHFCTADTFAPVMEILLEDCNKHTGRSDAFNTSFSATLLFVVVSVRKGTRITDWASLLSVLNLLVNTGPLTGTSTQQNTASAAAVAILYCPDVLKVVRSGLGNAIRTFQGAQTFLHICDFVVRIDRQRFRSCLLDDLKKFMANYDGEDDSIYDVFHLLPHLLEPGIDPKVPLHEDIQRKVVHEPWNMADSVTRPISRDMAHMSTILRATPVIQFSTDAQERYSALLTKLLETALDVDTELLLEHKAFLYGLVLEQCLQVSPNKTLSPAIIASLCNVTDSVAALPGFWRNIHKIVKQHKYVFHDQNLDNLQAGMLKALPLADHTIRENVLGIIQALYQYKDQGMPKVLETAILIESTPISLDTVRSISLNIRRLAADYATLEDEFLARAIPKYCLGLLHLRLSQAWDDATQSLEQMTTSTIAEQAVIETVQQWLFTPTDTHQQAAITMIGAEHPIYHVTSDFECPNLARMDALSTQIFTQAQGGRSSIEETFSQNVDVVTTVPQDARSQALKVLHKLSKIAEKRSRMIVPVLLQWAGPQQDDIDDYSSSTRWARKDQKAMLDVFSLFQNPTVLYRSAEVHDALLNLCRNGDLEIQKAAFKALLAWKTPSIARYQEHLLNILDETRFREELSVFLQGDEEEGLRAEDLPDVMPVLLRLLYGRVIGGGKEGQQVKRKAVFVALAKFPSHVMGIFVDIALSTSLTIKFIEDDKWQHTAAEQLFMPLRQQLGMLNMFSDMIDTLGSVLEPFGAKILNSMIGLTGIATKQLSCATATDLKDTSLLRAVRQTGLQALAKWFSKCHSDYSTECRVIEKELLADVRDNFVAENSQGISATLRLIAAWCSTSLYVSHLWATSDRLLLLVADILCATSVKTEVQLFVLDKVFGQLVSSELATPIPTTVSTHVAAHLTTLLQSQPEKDLLDACVRLLQKLAEDIQDSDQAHNILIACRVLLTQPSSAVSSKIKVGLLRTMLPLLHNVEVASDEQLYGAVCGMFSRLHDLNARSILSAVFTKLAYTSVERQEVSNICEQLNALNSGRLDEPDYEIREQGFVQVYEHGLTWECQQWLPVLHNCLHFIRDADDTVNRASAAKALRLLITAAGVRESLLPLVQDDLFGAIQRGMSQKSEFVRAEYLSLLNSIALSPASWKDIADLASLTVEGDDEASFFTNVLHIQHHRRLRALDRLADSTHVSSRNIMRIFLPLLEQFIFDQAEGDTGRTLSDRAVHTIGQLSKRLKWSDLRKTLLKYYGFLKSMDDLEKTVLRLIGAVIDGLSFSAHKHHELSVVAVSKGEKRVAGDDHFPNQDDVEDALAIQDGVNGQDTVTTSTPILPQNRTQIIIKDYLPPLQTFLHQKDESKVDRRVAVAISIVKLIRLLPEEEFAIRLAPTLTDISHILKSRDFEAREQTRRTLSAILSLIGPNYLQFMLKELRSALLRGYQLHVLSYTVHHLLVTNGNEFKAGDIDECIPELVAIVLDDIFGVTGQEKDAEEYKSGTKEVKSSKSYDTMEIVARMSSIPRLGQLILPIRALLQERLDSRLVKKVDDLLSRVRRGVDQNPASDSRDMLIFCHELVRQAYTQQHASGREAGLEDWKLKKYLTQAKSTPGAKGSTSSYVFKVTAFALALLRKVLRRHEDLQTAGNIAGFLPMIGDGLVGGEVDVKIESAKLLSTILSVGLTEIDQGIPVYLKEAIAMVKASHTTVTESARAGLDLATAILRERRDVEIREKDIAVLLRALKADLDEPDRQGQTFRFLRAVLGRKIVIPEVYEVMDSVARMLVNNPDESIRQNARAAYIQFVGDFPQGKERWAKTTVFLVKNLDYEHASGRKSVLEVVHTLLGRLTADALQDILLGLFVGLIPRIVSDSDAYCREMATVLIQRILDKAEDEQENRMRALASKWLQDNRKDSIRQVAAITWSILLRSGNVKKSELGLITDALATVLKLDTASTVASKTKMYEAHLELFLVLCETRPDVAFATISQPLWTRLLAGVSSASIPSRLAIRLLGSLYTNVVSTTAKSEAGLKRMRLQTSAGLMLDTQIWCDSCAAHIHCLRNAAGQSPELVADILKNLILFGRVFSANTMPWRSSKSEERTLDDEADDDDEASDAMADDDNSALGYLFSRLAYLVRREQAAPGIRLAALQAAAALVQLVHEDIPNVKLLIRPLYVLTDPAVKQSPGEDYKLLVEKAREAQDLLQTKSGAEQYLEMLKEAQKAVREKRDERTKKRRIDAIAHPELSAVKRMKRNELKREKSKAKINVYRAERRAGGR